jgi:uncharacterized membrane protein YbhN (UPF0104 family)
MSAILSQPGSSAPDQHRRRLICGGLVAGAVAVAATVAAVPSLIGLPARLVSGCGTWITLAGALELGSALSFVVSFKLVFGPRMTWRQGWPAGLRALGASTVLPAGGLFGPAAGALSVDTGDASASGLTRSVIAFVVISNAPGLIVLAAVGTALWLGWLGGPHEAALTLLPAGLALAVLAAGWLTRPAPTHGPARVPGLSQRHRLLVGLARPVAALRDGVTEAHRLVLAGNWKLLGAIGFYAFDNAVLWAAFRAYGRTPPLGVIIMAYLVGSLATALPTPAGLGAAEGGLIGALVLYGTPAAPAAVAVLLYRSISVGVALILGAVAWTPSPIARLRARPSVAQRPPGGTFIPPSAATELTAASFD